MFISKFSFALSLVAIELVILVYLFIKRSVVDYIGFYLMFLCLSIEFNTFVGSDTFYGFKNFRIAGVNLGVLCLLPVIILALFRKINFKEIRRRAPKFYQFALIITVLNISGVTMGLLAILFNDNDIQSLPNLFSSFIGVCYSMIIIPLGLIISFSYIINFEFNELEKLKKYVVAVFVGVSFSLIYSFFTKTFGYYAGVEILLVSSVSFLLPLLILYPFYGKRIYNNLSILIVAAIGNALLILFNANGKAIILCALLPVVYMAISLRNKNKIKTLFILSLMIAAFIFIIRTMSTLIGLNLLFDSKFAQAKSLVSFWQDNWLVNMAASPRFRVSEFLNVLIEYANKPQYILFGKGFMGTTKDHLNMFGQSYLVGTFSDGEWYIGSFYGMHETLNSILLSSGLFGILVYIYILFEFIKNLNKSYFYLIGGYWFLLFYGYSITISSIGIVCLFIGMTDLAKPVESIKGKVDK